MLLILTVFTMCSVAQAEEECDPGTGDAKWTLYLDGHIFALKGRICVFDEANGEWVGRDNNNNKIYFAGTYAIRSGYYTDSRKEGVSKDPRNWRGW